MNSKRLALLPLLCGCLCVSARTAESITIGFQPDIQQTTGAPVALDLVALDLGNFMSPSLGAFDLRIDFNPAVVSLTSVSFGPFLGTPGSGEALFQSMLVGPGAVNLVELSFLPPGALNARQPNAFALATLVFSPLALGDSPLLITVNALSNELGESFSFVKTEEGHVQFVPEPSALLTLGAGLLAIAAFLRARGRSRC